MLENVSSNYLFMTDLICTVAINFQLSEANLVTNYKYAV